MFHLRRSALRILSNPSTSLFCKTRSFTSFSPAPLRPQQLTSTLKFQRRWATSEAEAKKEEVEEEVPVSQLQPTPQEEVENAIHAENAGDQVETSTTTAANESPELLQEQESAAEKPSEPQSVVESVTESVSNAASSAAATVSQVAQKAGFSQEDSRKTRDELISTPKPTIYIGNLFFDVTENDLIKELSRFGAIKKCRLIRDNRGLSKGFGYIDFETTEAATQAVETLNQQLFEGRRLAVQYAAYETRALDAKRAPRGPNNPLNPPSKTLFIGNMSFDMTDRDLNQLFRGIRNVIDVRVAIDRRTGQPRGFAHADFIDVKSAMEAMKILEDKESYGRKLRIDYSYGPSNAPKNQASRDTQAPPSETD